ncbi:hypothetical protein L9F63_014812 [Diploptera punctata]|uniref:Gustatory receptor n=1 Tax=Diploptera punctata TaxID=6984 RepID=A0AAD8A703_DIPPU|nr:hypothetical protein L9F63_014812 [Diploptera punctata]
MNTDKETFNTTMKYWYILSQIFGIIPISPFIKLKKYESYKVKFLYISWTIIWIVLIAGFHCYQSLVRINYYLEKLSTQSIFLLASFCSIHVACIVNLINNIVLRNNFPQIMCKLWNVDKILIPRSGVSLYQKETFYSIKDIAVLSVFNIIIVIGVCWTSGVKSFTEILLVSVKHIPIFMNGIVFLQFKTFVKKLNERLKLVKKIVTGNTFYRQENLIKPKVSRTAIHFIEDAADTSAVTIVRQSEDLQLMRDVYMDLFKTKALIVSTYAIPIVLQLLTTHISCVGILYWGIRALFSKTDHLIAILNFIAVSYTLLLLTYVLLNCDNATEEAGKITRCIQEIIAKRKFPNAVECDLMKFVSQMKDMTFEFKPCGLFTLNLSLLCSTVGVICNYVVILIQFKD